VSDLVLHYTDSQEFGGAERVMLQILGGLDRDRWKPALMYHQTRGRMPLVERAAQLGVALHPVPPMPPGAAGSVRAISFAARLRKHRPAVFHAHLTWPLAGRNALMAAVLARVRAVVATLHVFVDLPYSRRSRFEQHLLIQRLGCYVAVSRHTAQRVRAAFDVPADKLRVIHNGVDATAFERAPDLHLRSSLAGAREGPLLVTTARLTEQKGLVYLLEAVAGLPTVSLAIVGDGPLRAELQERARSLGAGERVHFVGRQDDVAAWLASGDIFVLPSLFEGMPLAVLEAMAAGLPVIATDVGGTNEIVQHEQTGLLVAPRSSQALAHGIGRLAADPALSRRIALAGQALARQEFSETNMLCQLQHTYDELLGGATAYAGR
jgi:glycosyltransferase involved in cell wall biosynthesis